MKQAPTKTLDQREMLVFGTSPLFCTGLFLRVRGGNVTVGVFGTSSLDSRTTPKTLGVIPLSFFAFLIDPVEV